MSSLAAYYAVNVADSLSPAPEGIDCSSPDDSCTVTVILDILECALHQSRSEWIFLRELRVGTGNRNSSSQRLDAFALNCLPHQAMKRVCYEIKTSRADFLCEMRHPLKRRIGLRFSNEFFFVTPAGMLSSTEIPVECGLIEVGLAQTDDSRRLVRSHNGFFYLNAETSCYCLISIPAPWRDTPGPTWQFTAAMLRNQARLASERPPTPPKQQKLVFE